MSKLQIKALILKTVNRSSGVKAAQLVVDVTREVPTISHEDFTEALDELTNAKELVRIKYVVPNMSYREKEIFFPAGTRFSFEGSSLDL